MGGKASTATEQDSPVVEKARETQGKKKGNTGKKDLSYETKKSVKRQENTQTGGTQKPV